ncbi:hypothetical protein LR48_Vigan03g102700 [Vigna angularis]|uniref:Uncharacterized protein n=1 Tax=Phaseolus angularis TaxID=3914 RepID=A0A0L9U4D1_PHAAN|nr:hypothetical protein LR48_Vigan03g102700 [Vigna angularis]
MHDVVIVIVILSRMCMSNVNELICEVLSSRVFVIECYYFESMNDFAQVLPLSGSLPLSGTHEHPLAPLRGENAAEGKIDFALVPLSGSLPLSGGLLGLGPLFCNITNSI